MKRSALLLAAAAAMIAAPAQAGGRLETTKILGPLGGAFDLVQTVGIFWDDRCTNVVYTLDTVQPNVGAGTPISLVQTAAEIQASLDPWNNITTSFIQMDVGETRAVPGNRRFDFINEVTFATAAGFTALASSPSTSLIADTTFVVGMDIDGDGDVFDPVAAGRNTCYDHDNDGDIEFPAGHYLAGTILDNDVQFSPTFVWALEPNAASTVDIQAVAVHEFGHSHGLSHTLLNSISKSDGTGATMFPFIDITEAKSEAAARTLHVDDIAWSSFVYPEGTAASGPRALQPGDESFTSKFHVIRGKVTRPDGVGIVGANLTAYTNDGNDLGLNDDLEDAFKGRSALVDAFSGSAFLARNRTNGGLFLLGGDAGFADGNYTIPVPAGIYAVHMQALDGRPAAAGNISLSAQIGDLNGQLGFSEEFYNSGDSNHEPQPTKYTALMVPADTAFASIDLIPNVDVRLRNAGAVTNAGTAAVFGQLNVIYAERFSNASVRALLSAGNELTSALWDTTHQDASFAPKFKRALLAPGKVVGTTANIQLNKAYAEELNFVGQDSDLTPLYPSQAVGKKILKALDADPTLDLFLVLEQDNNFETGDSGLPPLLAIQAAAGTGNSYLSLNGSPFNRQTTRNWAVEMRFTPPSP